MDLDAGWAKVLTDWLQWGLGTMGAAGLLVWGVFHRRSQTVVDELRGLRSHTDARQKDLGVRVGMVEQTMARCDASGGCSSLVPRLVRIEEAMDRAPNHVDLNAVREKADAGLLRVHERVDRMELSLGRIEGQLGGVAENVTLLKTHILEHGPRAGDR
jgi:hypothetical protein